jgi:hypothetical protein
MMADSPAPEEQGLLEQGRTWLKDWWGAKNKEERVKTMWRLWLIVLGMVVIIGGYSLIKRQQVKAENTTGREWVEQASEGATNEQGRGMIPGSGQQPQEGAQPGMGQPGMGGQPGQGQQPGQPAQPGGAMGGRGSIPPSGGGYGR